MPSIVLGEVMVGNGRYSLVKTSNTVRLFLHTRQQLAIFVDPITNLVLGITVYCIPFILNQARYELYIIVNHISIVCHFTAVIPNHVVTYIIEGIPTIPTSSCIMTWYIVLRRYRLIPHVTAHITPVLVQAGHLKTTLCLGRTVTSRPWRPTLLCTSFAVKPLVMTSLLVTSRSEPAPSHTGVIHGPGDVTHSDVTHTHMRKCVCCIKRASGGPWALSAHHRTTM